MTDDAVRHPSAPAVITSVTTPDLFTLPPFVVMKITSERVTDLQRLFDRCSDYFVLHDGAPATPTAAAHELISLPPGRGVGDNVPIGVYDHRRECVGYCHIVRGYPEPAVWALGFLLIAPELRGL